ncbi:MAG: FHA domain-containing protein [Butyrivibrio sp.]|nr:FHA domain-containing protein [Muribaculum sp.]MCM1552942.1 FHA domain-containing protein [Butyrivibrio sp.]
MKGKLAVFLLICLLLQTRIPVLAAEAASEGGTASVVSAYCMGDTFYSFIETDGCDADKMVALTELVGGSQAQPVSFQESGAAVTYVLLIDNSGSMKKFAPSVTDYVNTLIECETQSAAFIIISFGEQVLLNEMVDTQACLDIDAVRNTALNAIEHMDYKERWTDPYTGIVSVLDYLNQNYPGNKGDLVNLIVMTDGTPDLKDSSVKEEIVQAAAERIAETPELVLHTVSFQAWDGSYAVPRGTGTDMVIDAGLNAVDAAEALTDFVHGLYRVDFEHFVSPDQVSGRYTYEYYLRDSGDGVTETIQLIPLVAEKVPIMTARNTGWSSPQAKQAETPTDEAETQSHETGEAESQMEPEPKMEQESKTEPEIQQAEDSGIQTGMFTNGIVWGVAAVLLVILALICIVVISLKRRHKRNADGGDTIFMRLEVLSGHCVSRRTEYYLKGELLIGRSSSCDIVWREAEVSPRNSRIFVKDHVVYIEDLDSKEGTLLEGMRIYSPNRLRSGDVISIGEVSFRFFF